jgi:hypothetical protein
MADPVLIQSKNARSGGGATALALAFTTPPTAGNLIISYIFGEDSAGTRTSWATDNVKEPHTKIVSQSGTATQFITSINCFVNVASGTTTVTANTSLGNHINLVIQEWANIVTTNSFDVGSDAKGNSTSATSLASAAIAQGNELVVGFMGAQYFPPITEAAGYTLDIKNTSVATEYKILTSGSGGQTATFTLTPSDAWQCQVATFKSTGVAAANQEQQLLLGMGN